MGGTYRIGRAAWALPKAHLDRFPREGTHLSRYAARFSAVEINSSFYRSHRPATYARWAASVPPDFRFSVKVPRTITHTARLTGVDALLGAFLGEVTELGDKLGCLLVQLPPSLPWDGPVSDAFLGSFRARFDDGIVIEPRHPTWFTEDVTERLRTHDVGRVAADPARVPEASEPAGACDVVYYRLHGSPRVYYSNYDDAYLDRLAARLRDEATRAREVWCIFDNTAHDHATPNALGLIERLT
jgi:uncharacterized protein YecE (DUF72 family)